MALKGHTTILQRILWDFSLPLYWFPCNYYRSGRNTYYCHSYIGVDRRVNPYKEKTVIIVMHQAFETPAPPHSGLSGAFTFYANESEWSPRFPWTKVSGAYPRPYFSTHGTPFVKQLIIAKRNTVVKKHCWQQWNKQIDLWAASK